MTLATSVRRYRRGLPRLYEWDDRTSSVWAFGYLTGKDRDLVCVIREATSTRKAENALSPICSNRFLAVLAFLLKYTLHRIDHNMRDHNMRL